jgi:hypothetical protein
VKITTGKGVVVHVGGHITIGGGTVPSAPLGLDDLTDVDLTGAVPGQMLQRMPDGTWVPVAFERPLRWLTDVEAPADTPAGSVLGTSGEGVWEPLSLAYIEEQIVAPLQAEIGDPHVVSAHTDLVGYIGELDGRLSAVEGSGEPVTPTSTLYVDKYSGTYTRVMAVGVTTADVKVAVALATTPGTNGAVFPDLGSIAGGAAVWVDFNGTLGRVNTADGSGVYGSALKEWIRKGSVLTVHRSDADPAHPTLVVTLIEQPTGAGSSLALGDLANVQAPGNTPVGKVLGTDAEGHWAPIDFEARIAALEARIAALESPAPAPPPAVPDATWTKDDIVLWLGNNGIDLNKKAEQEMTKDELLTLVANLLNP